MAQKDLLRFLNELDGNLKQSSDKYRTNTTNKVVHIFTLNPRVITRTVKTVLKTNGISENFITSSGEDGIKDVYDKAMSKLKKDVHDNIVTLRSKHPEEIRYPFPSVPPIITAKFLVTAKNASVYNRVVRSYQIALNEFYNTFVTEIKSATGKEKLERQSGSSNKMRSQEQAGQVFNLEHAGGTSNIEIFINDQMVDALEKVMNDSMQSDKDSMLAELAKLDPELRIEKNAKTGIVRVFIGNALFNTQQGGGKEKTLKKEIQAKVTNALTKLQSISPAELTGSDSLVTASRKKTVKKALKPFEKATGATVKMEDTKIKGEKSKASLKVAGTATRGRPKKQSLQKQNIRRQKTAKAQFNQAALLALFNARLPTAIINNMGDPALNNRTGRFAASVRVIDIFQTPKGFPSIGYTYRKSPYATFEQGGKQGSIELDPRRLIDKTIREIAAEQAMGRLFTRRL